MVFLYGQAALNPTNRVKVPKKNDTTACWNHYVCIQWMMNQQDGLETVANISSWPIQLLQDTFTDLRIWYVALILYKDIPGNKANFKRLQIYKFRYYSQFCLICDDIIQAQSNHVFFLSKKKTGPNQANRTERASKRCNIFLFFIARVPFSFVRKDVQVHSASCKQLAFELWMRTRLAAIFFCSFSTAGVYEDTQDKKHTRDIWTLCIILYICT